MEKKMLEEQHQSQEDSIRKKPNQSIIRCLLQIGNLTLNITFLTV